MKAGHRIQSVRNYCYPWTVYTAAATFGVPRPSRQTAQQENEKKKLALFSTAAPLCHSSHRYSPHFIAVLMAFSSTWGRLNLVKPSLASSTGCTRRHPSFPVTATIPDRRETGQMTPTREVTRPCLRTCSDNAIGLFPPAIPYLPSPPSCKRSLS